MRPRPLLRTRSNGVGGVLRQDNNAPLCEVRREVRLQRTSKPFERTSWLYLGGQRLAGKLDTEPGRARRQQWL
jgi:hypothetical protein